jgi:ADP-heptose:LPS heptosyltransferase
LAATSKTSVRNILVVRFGRLGDVLLLLPAIAALKHRWPDSSIALLTDERYAGIAKLCPFLDDVLPVDRLSMRDGSRTRALSSLTRLVKDLRRRRFDLAVDFHGFSETQLLVGLSGARLRYGLKRPGKTFLGICFNRAGIPEDKDVHVRDMFLRIAEVVTQEKPVIPQRVLSPPAFDPKVEALLPQSPFAVFYVGARAGDHVWPAARFAALADRVVVELEASVVLIGGSSAAERGAPTEIRMLCAHHENVVALENLKIDQMVSVVNACRMLVSNDSGPMHIGPAVGTSTLGLFSLSLPQHYRPSGPDDEVVSSREIAAMPVDVVFSAVRRMWSL